MRFLPPHLIVGLEIRFWWSGLWG